MVSSVLTTFLTSPFFDVFVFFFVVLGLVFFVGFFLAGFFVTGLFVNFDSWLRSLPISSRSIAWFRDKCWTLSWMSEKASFSISMSFFT